MKTRHKSQQLRRLVLLGFSSPPTGRLFCTFLTQMCEPTGVTNDVGLSFDFTPRHEVPELATLTLFGLGLQGLGVAQRRKKQAAW
jgi:hypothetical protein